MAPNRVLGLLLIGLGAFLAVILLTDLGGEVIVISVGLVFLAAYAATRTYGLLIPGGIVTGLGAGILIESAGGPSGSVVLGLGAGFLAIALIDVLVSPGREAWWWPLIPGGILTLVGASDTAGWEDTGAFVVPAVLIVVGVLILLRRGPSDQTPPAQPPAPPSTPAQHQPPQDHHTTR
jgi:hypothetical protein